ncbi:MAG: PIN domain-containing protein [Candidatus Acidiferrales bacterium]
MMYLLDVNALVALSVLEHEFHDQAAKWVQTLASKQTPELATCSITELGYIRVLLQAPQYGFSVAEARALLLRIKTANTLKFTFLSDDHDLSHIPAWVKTAKQTTDGHLAQLAKAKGGVLATLDRNIPGAFQIPDDS